MEPEDNRKYLAWLKKQTFTPPKGKPMPKEKAMVTVSLDAVTQSTPGVLIAEASMLRWPAGRWPKMFLLEGLADGPQMAMYKHYIDNGAVHIYKTLNYELHVIND